MISLVSRIRRSPADVPFWGHVLFVGALAIGFYLYVRPFPLHGEDGAFNYMSMLERLHSEDTLSFSFGYKLVEGLGQPNPFLTILFDPFSWPLLAFRFFKETPQRDLVVFQSTMALRVIVCWLGTYLFAASAFPGPRTVAATTAYLNVFLSFFLAMNIGSTEIYAAMYNGTQTALLPLVAGLYVRGIDLGKPLVSANGLAVFVLLFFLVLSYPVGSMVAIAVLIGVAAAIPIVGGAAVRRSACVHLLGLAIMVGVILLLPGLDPVAAWQGFARLSSRLVFADELRPYFVAYSPPTFWFTPPIGSRLIVLCAIAGLLVIDRIPPLARSIVVALVLIVAGIQSLYFVSATGIFGDLVQPLPPLTRIERHLPPLYAFSAAIALYAAERLLVANGGWRFLLWCAGAAVLAIAGVYVFVGVYGILAPWGLSRTTARDLTAAAVVTLLALAFVYNALRLFAPGILPAALRQRAGPIGAGPDPAKLAHAAVSYAFIAAIAAITALIWASKPFFIAGYLSRDVLCDRITVLGCRDSDFGRDVNAGSNPITGFLQSRLTSSEIFAGRAEYLSPYDKSRPSSADPIAERERNFLDIGNSMVFAGLSFHGIAVASTYEQSHDYLYYLFWTRYLTQDSRVRYSPNWTGLYQFLPGPLALAGVRYVVAREAARAALGPTPIVFTWKDFVVAELAEPNTRGYGVTRLTSATTIAEALSAMRRPDFDPRGEAVLLDADRRRLPEGELQPVTTSEIATRSQIVHLMARSAGKASLIVLPFRFSHCWEARWNGAPGTLVRADIALLAVYFEGTVDVSLSWRGGYGALARCLEADASLIAEARVAAKQLPY